MTEEVAGALALSAAFAPINRDLFGDFGARIGTGDALRRPGMADGGASIWARGGGTSHDGGASDGGSEVDFDTIHFFVQLGLDAFRAEAAGGSFVGSVMAQYGNADVMWTRTASVRRPISMSPATASASAPPGMPAMATPMSISPAC